MRGMCDQHRLLRVRLFFFDKSRPHFIISKFIYTLHHAPSEDIFLYLFITFEPLSLSLDHDPFISLAYSVQYFSQITMEPSTNFCSATAYNDLPNHFFEYRPLILRNIDSIDHRTTASPGHCMPVFILGLVILIALFEFVGFIGVEIVNDL